MRFKAFITVIIILFVFTGCNEENTEIYTEKNEETVSPQISGEDAVKKFNDSVDAFFNSSSYKISESTNVNISAENKDGKIEMLSEVKTKKDNEGKETAILENTFKMAEINEKSIGYYKDGYYYHSTNKRKVQLDYKDVLTEGNINIFKLTKESLNPGTEPNVKKIGDEYSVDFDLNVAVLQKEIPEFIPNLTSYLRVSEIDFIMKRCRIEAVIGEDGILKSCDFYINAVDTVYSGTSEKDFKSVDVDCDIEIKADISDINSVDFEISENLDEYKDVA